MAPMKVIAGIALILALPGLPPTVGGGGALAEQVQPRTNDKSIDALQQGYSASVKANEFYAAAARKADSEGHAGVGSLFRAAARSAQLHSEMFSKQLTALKATAAVRPGSVTHEVKTTKDNLKTAVDLTTKLRDTDLPAWGAACRGEGNLDAEKACRWVRQGQIELRRFFREAGDLLEKWKNKREFFISRTCGFPVEKLDMQQCPVCGQGKDDFEKVE